jgi:hypothetical protein
MENKYGVFFDIGHWDLRHEYAMGGLTRRLMTDSIDSRLLRTLRVFIKPFLSSYKKMIKHYVVRNEAFIRAALDVSGKQVFFDATKSFLRIQLLRENPLFKLKILHLVRDPRGYVHSAKKHNKRSAHVAAREWVKQNEYIENNLRQIDSQKWIRLRFEALCFDPEETLDRLANFVGVESFAESTDGFGEKEHHIIGNNMRLRPNALKTVRLDEKWRETLSIEDINIVRHIAGDHARKYGYDI